MKIKKKRYPDGGISLFNTNRTAYVDSVLNSNKNLDWVQRLYEKDTPSLQIPGEQFKSTHLMSDNGEGFIFPRIVREKGVLRYFPTEDEAYNYSKQTNTGIQLPKERGSWFSANGYKQGTGVLKEDISMKRNKKKYAVGAIIGQLIGIGDMIGKPIKEASERTNPYTGEFLNKKGTTRASQAGLAFDPLRTGIKTFTDPNASSGEKWGVVGSIMGLPGLAGKFGKARANRLEEENKRNAFLARNPNTVGQSYNPYYMATGGRIAGRQLAELEDGEVFQTPNGLMEQVNGNTHAQGGEDLMLPEGTSILGKNKSKIFNKQFKEMGQNLKRRQDMHTKNMESNSAPIAKRTSKIMLDRLQKQWDALLQEQEMQKMGQGKTSGKYPKGGIIPKYAGGNPYIYRTDNSIYDNLYSLTAKQIADYNKYTSFSEEQRNTQGYLFGTRKNKPITPTVTPVQQSYNNTAPSTNYVPKVVPQNKSSVLGQDIGYNPDESIATEKQTYLDSLGGQGSPAPQDLSNTIPTQQGTTQTKPNFFQSITGGDTGKVGNVVSGIADIAPIVYNAIQGMSKSSKFNYQDYINPYIADIRSAMRARRYNINPELEANRLAQAGYNYNLRNAGAPPSQLQGGLQAGAISRMRGDSTVRATQQNMNSQYLADQAQMDYSTGRDVSALKTQGYDINERNAAAKRNFMATATSQLQQYSQTKQLEKNQLYRDAQRMGLLNDLFEDFTFTNNGWVFKLNGTTMTEDEVKNYLKQKR